MKFVAVILLLIPLALGADVKEAYANWMRSHSRQFVSKKHAGKSYNNFQANHETIEKNNAAYEKNEASFRMRHNDFSDWDKTRFMKSLVNFAELETPSARAGSTPLRVPANFVADQYDLTTDKVPVKNQGGCGSCWAFSAVGTLEFDSLQRLGYYLDFSEQNCVDCARARGCSGGFMHECLGWYKANGMNLEHKYPYVMSEIGCQRKPIDMDKYYAPEFYSIPPDERLMAYVIKSNRRWISACLDASNLEFYEGTDIVRTEGCSKSVNHAIVITGYGTDRRTGMKYWIIRNSWGDDWGNKGYCKLQRDVNACGIAHPYEGYRSYPASPTLYGV